MCPDRSRCALYGHRGARGEVVENTLASFAHAFETGVDGVELDVGLTADGVPVVAHDRRLNRALARGPSGRWLEGEGPTVGSLTVVELRQYDVGRVDPCSDYAREHEGQRQVDGERVPALAEVIDLMRARAPGAEAILEIKTSPLAPHETAAPERIGDAVVALLEERRFTHAAIVESFDWRVMDHLRGTGAGVRTAHLTARQPWFDTVSGVRGRGSPWTGGRDVSRYGDSVPDMVADAGGRIWAPHFGDVDAGAMERARALDLEVVVWTVNEASALLEMLRLGVDGVITDYPTRLGAVLRGPGPAAPPAGDGR